MASRRSTWLVLVVATSALSGCVSYEPAPLDRTPHLATTARSLEEGANGHAVTAAALDQLVLRNNPDLRAARAKLGVADAQILEAGLLPNPQFAASYPFFISGPNGSDGFALGLAQDLRSILLRPTRREVAANAASAVHASLLWQEWQTVGKARLLFVQLAFGERLGKVIARSRKLLKDRFDVTNTSIDKGNAPLATLSPDLLASSETQKVEDDLARLQLSRRHELNALLGLAPDAPLRLAAESRVAVLDAARVRRDLATLADRRPDLVALQYGYRSEDAQVRQAILSQYPNLVVGVLGGRDTSMVYSAGPQASFELPIFDHNEGSIALAEATRTQLRGEFDARLSAAAGEVGALLSEQAMLRRQLAALEPRLKQAHAIADKTETAFRQGVFDERAYVDVELALLMQEQQKIGLEQTLLEQQVSLAALMGAGLPPIAIGPEPAPANPLGLLPTAAR